MIFAVSDDHPGLKRVRTEVFQEVFALNFGPGVFMKISSGDEGYQEQCLIKRLRDFMCQMIRGTEALGVEEPLGVICAAQLRVHRLLEATLKAITHSVGLRMVRREPYRLRERSSERYHT